MRTLTPTREWVAPSGVRCIEVSDPELAGETMIDFRDLTKWLLALDLRQCEDLEKRELIAAFQREAHGLEPAVAHRRAVALLESFGAVIPESFRRPFVRAVTA